MSRLSEIWMWGEGREERYLRLDGDDERRAMGRKPV